jgi:glycogen synthase
VAKSIKTKNFKKKKTEYLDIYLEKPIRCMKVLMFGWEFPPHISGGLGTACYGLTHSLGKEDVDVLFVVPKLHGDEPAERMHLINASDIRIKKPIYSPSKFPLGSNIRLQTYITQGEKNPRTEKEKNLSYIEVPSGISAYRAVDLDEDASAVERWNYEILARQPAAAGLRLHKNKRSDRSSAGKNSEEITYAFSGAYGADLLTEVEYYAEVAKEIAKRFSFDVIHAHDWMTYPAAVAAKQISGKPLVVHVHATEFDRSGELVDGRVRNIEKQGMEMADRVVTVSEWTKKIAVSKYRIDPEKITVVYNGIVPRKKIRIEFDSPLRHSPIVTFLGRITHQKGPLYFVDAAKQVLHEIPDARFIVAGSGDLLPKMIQQVAHAGMSSRFHFTGFLNNKDIQKIWSISNVYVMPSVSEPFGIAPLEAIQAGVPVIISRQSGVAEIMPHAITVDFWNTTALADSICSVLKYKSLYRTLKKNSKTHIRNITWDRAAKTINTLYHELVEQ